MKLYIDDSGFAPRGWRNAASYSQAIALFEQYEVDEVSLGGAYCSDEEDLLKWIFERVISNDLKAPKITLRDTARSKLEHDWMLVSMLEAYRKERKSEYLLRDRYARPVRDYEVLSFIALLATLGLVCWMLFT